MTENALNARLRSEFSTSGWILLVYYGIMNVAVTVAVALDVAFRAIQASFSESTLTYELLEEVITAAMGNGWGYIIATVTGAVLLYIWKKREFCLKTIWKQEKQIRPGAFFSIAAIFFGVQAFAQVMAIAMEWFFGLFGLSILESMEAASIVGDSVSMFLYAGFFAPIFEEILFRGLLLRLLQPYGKKFSVLATAFLFGVFHGNIIQTPYAFLVGLVLGYVAVEYSILWAMLLHILNNLVLADLMTRLSRILPPGVGDLISGFFIWGCAIAAVVVLIMKRHEVSQYLREKKMHPLCVKNFFASPGVIVLSAIMAGNILLTFLMQIFA